MLLLQDNARSHTALLALEIIGKVGWEILRHTFHNYDLASYDIICLIRTSYAWY